MWTSYSPFRNNFLVSCPVSLKIFPPSLLALHLECKDAVSAGVCQPGQHSYSQKRGTLANAHIAKEVNWICFPCGSYLFKYCKDLWSNGLFFLNALFSALQLLLSSLPCKYRCKNRKSATLPDLKPKRSVMFWTAKAEKLSSYIKMCLRRRLSGTRNRSW